MHKLLVGMFASAVFGGSIGALATAAVQSQASSQAAAAAVQHVQDIPAETTLKRIEGKLTGIDSKLTGVDSRLRSVDGRLTTMASDITYLKRVFNGGSYGILETIQRLLQPICEGTRPTSFDACPFAVHVF